MLNMFFVWVFSVEHCSERAAREQAEANGGNSEKWRFIHWETEAKWRERKNSKECDGEDVNRAIIWSHVFLPYDGSNLFRSFGEKVEWCCHIKKLQAGHTLRKITFVCLFVSFFLCYLLLLLGGLTWIS